MTNSPTFLLSIVIPVHDEEECVSALVREIERHVPAVTENYEIIFVDDHSRDATFANITTLAHANDRIRCLRLSRNMGHQVALACGLEAACGDVVIMMDGDLQHPPVLIPQLVAEWRRGHDVVNTARNNPANNTRLKSWLSRLFYHLFNRLSSVTLIPAGADFRLLDRKCVEALNAMREHFKFFRGMIPYIGFSQTTIFFDCPPRYAGKKSYTFRKSLKLATDGLLSFSTVGLNIPFTIGGLIIATALVYFIATAVLVLTGKTPLVQGWASIMALIFLSIGLQFTCLGIFGLYLGKIFIEVKNRPAYFIQKTIGFSERHNRPQTYSTGLPLASEPTSHASAE